MEKIRITGTAVAERLLHDKLCGLDHEEAWAIFLNGRAEVISVEMLTKGVYDSTSLDARTVMRRALLLNAFGVLLAHNHPSGNERPSPSDIKITKDIQEAGHLLNVILIDHLIMTEDNYFSFCEDRSFNITR